MVCYIQVKELGNPKNKKGKDSPPHVDICETVRPIIENGDELPLPLLCRLIKFKILWLKQNDMQRIAAEKKVNYFFGTFSLHCLFEDMLVWMFKQSLHKSYHHIHRVQMVAPRSAMHTSACILILFAIYNFLQYAMYSGFPYKLFSCFALIAIYPFRLLRKHILHLHN